MEFDSDVNGIVFMTFKHQYTLNTGEKSSSKNEKKTYENVAAVGI